MNNHNIERPIDPIDMLFSSDSLGQRFLHSVVLHQCKGRLCANQALDVFCCCRLKGELYSLSCGLIFLTFELGLGLGG